MATPKGSNPGGLQVQIQNALSGVQQDLPAGSALLLNNASTTQAQIVSALSAYLTAFQTVANEKAAYAKAVQARKAVQAPARAYLALLRAALVALFGGSSSPMLAKFGMDAKVRTKPNTQTAVMAAAKRTLTRKKRGTLGSKQKAAIAPSGAPQLTIDANGLTVTPPAESGAAPGVQTTLAPVVPVPAVVAGK